MAASMNGLFQPLESYGEFAARKADEEANRNALLTRVEGERQRQAWDEKQNAAAEAASAEAQHHADLGMALGAAQHLSGLSADPAKFSRAADALVSTPWAQRLGLTRDHITPEEVSGLVDVWKAQGASLPEKAPISVAAGTSLVRQKPDGTLETLFTGPSNNKPDPAPSGYRWSANGNLMAIPGGPGDLNRPGAASESSKPPAGYRWTNDGGLEAIPGGPGDNNRPGHAPPSMNMRKEFRALPSVKAYEESLPVLVSARNAPNTGAGDINLVYAVGKIMDPGSVVREGELRLAVDSGGVLARVLGSANVNLTGGARLQPEVRKRLLDMLNERVLAYRQAYDRDFAQYGEYATASGLRPEDVTGKHVATAYAPAGTPAVPNIPAPVRVRSLQEARALPPGTPFITPDGQRKVR